MKTLYKTKRLMSKGDRFVIASPTKSAVLMVIGTNTTPVNGVYSYWVTQCLRGAV